MHRWRMAFKCLFVVFLISSLIVTVFAGCGSNGGKVTAEQVKTSGTVKQPGQSEAPAKLSIMVQSVPATDPVTPDLEHFQRLQKLTNSELNIDWAAGDYNTRFSAAVVSGNLPQIIMCRMHAGKDSVLINAVKSGVFWEIGPYLKDYPNFSKLNGQTMKNVAIEGKIYGIPRQRDIASEGVIYRKDWLKKLGLKEPSTIDELYTMFKSFALSDPDKNGKDDTVGYMEYNVIRGGEFLNIIHGSPNGWEFKDGKVTPDFYTQEYLNSMKFIKRLYDEKIINQNFAMSQRSVQTEYLEKNKAGAFIADLDQSDRFEAVKKIDPNAEFDVVSRIKGPKGDRVTGTVGYNGIFLFPKSSVKTEGELKRILSFINTLLDPKVEEFLFWGTEGKHFENKDGKPARTQAQNDLYTREMYGLRTGLGISLYKSVTIGQEAPLTSKYKKMYQDNLPIAVSNISNSLLSMTFIEKGAELDKMIKEARVQFIMGAIDEAGWKSVIKKWQNAGGDKIIDEFSQDYKNSNK